MYVPYEYLQFPQHTPALRLHPTSELAPSPRRHRRRSRLLSATSLPTPVGRPPPHQSITGPASGVCLRARSRRSRRPWPPLPRRRRRPFFLFTAASHQPSSGRPPTTPSCRAPSPRHSSKVAAANAKREPQGTAPTPWPAVLANRLLPCWRSGTRRQGADAAAALLDVGRATPGRAAPRRPASSPPRPPLFTKPAQGNATASGRDLPPHTVAPVAVAHTRRGAATRRHSDVIRAARPPRFSAAQPAEMKNRPTPGPPPPRPRAAAAPEIDEHGPGGTPVGGLRRRPRPVDWGRGGRGTTRLCQH